MAERYHSPEAVAIGDVRMLWMFVAISDVWMLWVFVAASAAVNQPGMGRLALTAAAFSAGLLSYGVFRTWWDKRPKRPKDHTPDERFKPLPYDWDKEPVRNDRRA